MKNNYKLSREEINKGQEFFKELMLVYFNTDIWEIHENLVMETL